MAFKETKSVLDCDGREEEFVEGESTTRNGKFLKGSFPDRLAKLKPEQYFLLPYEFAHSSNVHNQIERYEKMVKGQTFEVKVCYAFDIALSDKPFKLFQVKRIS